MQVKAGNITQITNRFPPFSKPGTDNQRRRLLYAIISVKDAFEVKRPPMSYLQIEITDEERQYLEQLAHEQGFETPEAYVKSVVLEPTKAELLRDIREGLLAVQRGDPMPSIEELWAELESDQDETAG